MSIKSDIHPGIDSLDPKMDTPTCSEHRGASNLQLRPGMMTFDKLRGVEQKLKTHLSLSWTQQTERPSSCVSSLCEPQTHR